MAERKMSEALEEAKHRTTGDGVAAKRRAILDPEVGAFIRVGALPPGTTASDPPHRTARAATADMQLNTRVPADLYQRARRAVFECQMSETEPCTIQDLVSQALRAELKRLGF